MNLINEKIFHFTPNYATLHPKKMLEENLKDVIKIDKDNLTPK